MAENAYLYDLYCEGRLIGRSKVALQIADLMGISTEQVAAFAKTGKPIHGRYKVIQQNKKVDVQRVIALQDWDNMVKPFRRVEWVKEPGAGVKKLEVKPR